MDSLKGQTKETVHEFEKMLSLIISQIAEQGLNACPYYKNKDFRTVISICPISAFTGEGIPDLLLLIVLLSQKYLFLRLKKQNTFQCNVLEVKIEEKVGSTIDVLLVHGTLKLGDKIVLCGMNGPILTSIRQLLVPKPLQETRDKEATCEKIQMIQGVHGVKIFAKDLDKVIAGSQLFVVNSKEDEEIFSAKVMEDLKGILMKVNKSREGVYVQVPFSFFFF